jgi:hypothetical protein
MTHRVRPTLLVFKNMNVPLPLLSHIRSFSFLFVFFRSFFRSCVFLPFRSRARSFVGRIRARFVSFRFGVCARRDAFSTSSPLSSSVRPRPRAGVKKEKRRGWRRRKRVREVREGFLARNAVKTTTTHVREREGHGRRWKDQSPTPRAFLMKRSSTRNETKTNTRRVRLALARMKGGFRSFVRSRGWWGGGDVGCTVIH